jgi:hypothetical protein
MSLRELQSEFVVAVAKLVLHGTSKGYEFTFGEAWRTPEQAALNAARGTGIRASLHVDRLAIDLNLFRDGHFLSDSEFHRPLSVYWKTLHPLACWGGDFRPNPDGNHYSFTWQGRK